mmetsp:Transcript_38219/g.126570  ORF Transcript_38219/g.126570 Transcript_38219/m.126570 type:complete len:231 (+) Transcript_38219:1314-2006(+)
MHARPDRCRWPRGQGECSLVCKAPRARGGLHGGLVRQAPQRLSTRAAAWLRLPHLPLVCKRRRRGHRARRLPRLQLLRLCGRCALERHLQPKRDVPVMAARRPDGGRLAATAARRLRHIDHRKPVARVAADGRRQPRAPRRRRRSADALRADGGTKGAALPRHARPVVRGRHLGGRGARARPADRVLRSRSLAAGRSPRHDRGPGAAAAARGERHRPPIPQALEGPPLRR